MAGVHAGDEQHRSSRHGRPGPGGRGRGLRGGVPRRLVQLRDGDHTLPLVSHHCIKPKHYLESD